MNVINLAALATLATGNNFLECMLECWACHSKCLDHTVDIHVDRTTNPIGWVNLAQVLTTTMFLDWPAIDVWWLLESNFGHVLPIAPEKLWEQIPGLGVPLISQWPITQEGFGPLPGLLSVHGTGGHHLLVPVHSHCHTAIPDPLA